MSPHASAWSRPRPRTSRYQRLGGLLIADGQRDVVHALHTKWHVGTLRLVIWGRARTIPRVTRQAPGAAGKVVGMTHFDLKRNGYMKRLLRRRPSPAMLVALLALFVAMGGSSYAAVKD